MLSKLGSHARHNVVGYLALFFALTGVAYAAGPLKPGDPAGGDLTGTYPDPGIVSSITRDSEIFPTVLANDGPTSNLDADKLDGLNSTALARVGGIVNADGTVGQAYGANPTVTHGAAGSGLYAVEFPEGTFTSGCHFPAAVVTPVPVTGQAIPSINGLFCVGSGGGRLVLLFHDLDGTPRDTSFTFIAL